MTPVTIGSRWKRRGGGEVLRIGRVWFVEHATTFCSDPPAWFVRGHPINGGRPLVCTATYLRDNYAEQAVKP